MSISTVAFFGLGIWAIIKMTQMYVNGEATLQDDASIFQATALVLVVLAAPFLLCWGSVKMAKKALAQIREDGWIYKG